MERAYIMTQNERTQVQKDVMIAFYMTKEEVMYHRSRLALIGEKIERLGLALQQHPELITPLPEPTANYDYRDELNAISDRQTIINLCAELRDLEQKRKNAEMRKEVLHL